MIITYNSPISDLLPFLDRIGISARLRNQLRNNSDCEVSTLLNADTNALIDMHLSRKTITEFKSIKPEIESYIKSLSFKDTLKEELTNIKEQIGIYQVLIQSLLDRVKILEKSIDKLDQFHG